MLNVLNVMARLILEKYVTVKYHIFHYYNFMYYFFKYSNKLYLGSFKTPFTFFSYHMIGVLCSPFVSNIILDKFFFIHQEGPFYSFFTYFDFFKKYTLYFFIKVKANSKRFLYFIDYVI